MSERWLNVPCPGCGCVCDDVAISFEEEKLVAFEPHCQMGEQWFRTHCGKAPSSAAVNGQPVSMSAALDHAAKLLTNANYPLIYGLSRSATSGQRAAIALAERLGAAIDTTASLCHGPSIMALQQVGEVTCTLGEIRNRADLIIYWGCHPAESHPRHAERYSAFSRGRYTPAGRENRTIVMVGEGGQVEQWRLNPDGAKPDFVVPIEPSSDFESISLLRMMLREGTSAEASPELQRLLELMRNCEYGVVFFGLGITETSMWDGLPHEPTGHANVAALLQLVADLNNITRFTARRMRMQGDVSGADNVLCWQTGYPFGVDMSRGYPRYNPGEFTANELLAEQNTDACLLVGAETVQYFSAAARRHLESIPTILLDYAGAVPEFIPHVHFTTATYGIHAAGTAYRMDNIPISLQAPLANDEPTDEFVLNELLNRCPLDEL